MRYEHVIWDWNGTLFDDAWLSVEVINHVLGKRGMATVTRESYEAMFDFPVIDYYRRLGFDFAQESFEEVGTEFIVEYERRRHECSLRDGAREVLAAISGMGMDQSILSAYKQETLDELTDYFGLRDFFRTIVGLDNHYASGKLDLGQRLMAGLEPKARQVLFVGDTVHDYDVAREIGADCVLIPSGHNPRQKLEKCGVPVLNSIRELSGLLLKG
jgi:phosphoglycolate phosphatase